MKILSFSLKSRIIECAAGSVEPTQVINVLQEMAFEMHFSRKASINQSGFDKIIEQYNGDYRQSVRPLTVLRVLEKSGILKENDNGIYFKDRTIIAYFVAHAILFKYNNGDDIQENIDYLLSHLCFGINSDIVLFLALIANNTRFLNLIINGANRHFENQIELSFDDKNISFLSNATIPVKNTVPDTREKELRENNIEEREREVRPADIVELVNEYDYSEDELKDIRNQIMISFKYLEVLSKALPAFCQSMKINQQDELVGLIYRCPNKFLYSLLADIDKDFEDFCSGLYEEISELKHEKNQVSISLESIRRATEQVAATLVLALYKLVAMTASSKQSIKALNAFECDDNSNYRLQNLMMRAMVDELEPFSKRAKKMDRKADSALEKSIIRFTVRDYLLRNNIEFYKEGQSLLEHFFGDSSAKKIKDTIAKKRFREDNNGTNSISNADTASKK